MSTQKERCEQRNARAPRQRPADDLDASGRDGRADRAGIALGVHERVRRAKLLQTVDVAVADNRLPTASSPPLRAPVEIDGGREHRIAFDSVEQIGVAIQIAPETTGR